MLNWKILMIHFREMSTLQSTMKGKGDEEMQHIQVFYSLFKYIAQSCLSLPLFFTLIAPVCRFPTSWTPGRSTSWSGRRWRPKKAREWARQRRNFVTTVILVMLPAWQVLWNTSEARSSNKAAAHTTTNSRHRQIFPPAKEEEDGRQTSWSRL